MAVLLQRQVLVPQLGQRCHWHVTLRLPGAGATHSPSRDSARIQPLSWGGGTWGRPSLKHGNPQRLDRGCRLPHREALVPAEGGQVTSVLLPPAPGKGGPKPGATTKGTRDRTRACLTASESPARVLSPRTEVLLLECVRESGRGCGGVCTSLACVCASTCVISVLGSLSVCTCSGVCTSVAGRSTEEGDEIFLCPLPRTGLGEAGSELGGVGQGMGAGSVFL